MFRLVQALLQDDVAAHPEDSAAAGAPRCLTQYTCALACLCLLRARVLAWCKSPGQVAT